MIDIIFFVLNMLVKNTKKLKFIFEKKNLEYGIHKKMKCSKYYKLDVHFQRKILEKTILIKKSIFWLPK